MKTLKLFILFISLLSLQTCKREQPYKVYGPYTLGEGKDYLNFKPGSWWVYKNSKSGLYDTMVLRKITFGMRTYEGKNMVIKEKIDMEVYSTTGYKYGYFSTGINPDAKTEILEKSYVISVIVGKAPKGGYIGFPSNTAFFYPFETTHNSTGIGDYCNYLGSDSILTLKGNTYHQVQKFFLYSDDAWDNEHVNYYWAKDVGIIKRENLKKNESWELVNYFVEKP